MFTLKLFPTCISTIRKLIGNLSSVYSLENEHQDIKDLANVLVTKVMVSAKGVYGISKPLLG